jgi:hypothetical protein
MHKLTHSTIWAISTLQIENDKYCRSRLSNCHPIENEQSLIKNEKLPTENEQSHLYNILVEEITTYGSVKDTIILVDASVDSREASVSSYVPSMDPDDSDAVLDSGE